MRALIVGRTKMGNSNHRCIGGLCADGRSIRLLDANGDHWDVSVPFQLGQVWELQFHEPASVRPPHVEDVIVTSYKLVGTAAQPRSEILQLVQPWQGGASVLFDGRVGYTANHNGYISESRGVPDRSTWFWIPEKDLVLRADGKHYDHPAGGMMGLSFPRGLSYVGEPLPPAIISAGTLVRVSLARWWKPENADASFKERCYVQLSGWF